MAKKITDKSGWILELDISEKFINKYKVEKFVSDPIYFNILLSPEPSGEIKYPFRFKEIYSFFNDNIDVYLSSIRFLLEKYQIDKKHEDHLIFFSNVLFHIKNETEREIFKSHQLRTNGNLLVELIEVPFTKYNIENFHEQFDNETSADELDDLLFMYLGIVSGLPEESFKDGLGKLDRNKITSSIDYNLMERLTADKNISIKIEDPVLPKGFKYLIISNEVIIKFKSNKKQTRGNIPSLNQSQNDELIRLVVNQLVEEQKREGTALYNAILNHNFFVNTSELGKSVGKWHHSNHLGQDLYRLYTLLIEYLDDETILSGKSDPLINRKRSDFILHYFILMGWMNHKGNFLKSTDMASINKELTQLYKVKRLKPNHSSKILNDIFKPMKSPLVTHSVNS